MIKFNYNTGPNGCFFENGLIILMPNPETLLFGGQVYYICIEQNEASKKEKKNGPNKRQSIRNAKTAYNFLGSCQKYVAASC